MRTRERILEDAGSMAAMLEHDIRRGNGAKLAFALAIAEANAALSASKLAGAELDVKLAEALAWNEGKVVGANAEARAASAMGFTAAARKLVIERKLEHDLNESMVECCKQAIRLVVSQGDRSRENELLNQLAELSAKHDALEKVAQEMDAQLSSEQRKEREMSDGF